MLISGAAIAEIIFGAARASAITLLHAIFQRDYPDRPGPTLLIAVVFVVVNFLVDIALRPARPEDHRPMTAVDRAPGGPVPRRRGWRCPRAGATRSASSARHRRLRRPHRALRAASSGRSIPNNPVYDRLLGAELGAPDGHRRPRPRHARADHPRRPGLAPGRRDRDRHQPHCGPRHRPRLPRFYRGPVDLALMRVRRHPVRVPAADPGDPDRRPARAVADERDDRDRDRLHAGVRARHPRGRARGDGLARSSSRRARSARATSGSCAGT